MSTHTNQYNELFSSVISEIKSYSGRDPLLPWLRGIRKIREALPHQLLKDKLPRFLQKCAQTFEADRRYANDLRYLRIWLQLMDFVDDPKPILRTMEVNQIGMKKSLFYQAYALYYEKMKKFEAAEKMYHLGVRNLAEPLDDLQKSYEQFLLRVKRHKNRKSQQHMRGPSSKAGTSGGNLPKVSDQNCCQNLCEVDGEAASAELNKPEKGSNTQIKGASLEATMVSGSSSLKMRLVSNVGCKNTSQDIQRPSNEHLRSIGEDTVVVKFVGNAIVGKSATEDACHHGLVEPTINTKEAIDAINSMFREPLEPFNRRRFPSKQQTKDRVSNNEFEIFTDEKLNNSEPARFSSSMPRRSDTHPPLQEPLQIYVDSEDIDNTEQSTSEEDNTCQNELPETIVATNTCGSLGNGFVFPGPNDISVEETEDVASEKPVQSRVREDTVVYRFVGSTIVGEPEVENVCHHGLVEPTVNLKEAMAEINSMFGEPIEFTRKRRPKKQDNVINPQKTSSAFLILPDDEVENQPKASIPAHSVKSGSDMYEQTICTKEAMDEINKMFGMPLDF